jgi:hypothetical protein
MAVLTMYKLVHPDTQNPASSVLYKSVADANAVAAEQLAVLKRTYVPVAVQFDIVQGKVVG